MGKFELTLAFILRHARACALRESVFDGFSYIGYQLGFHYLPELTVQPDPRRFHKRLTPVCI